MENTLRVCTVVINIIADFLESLVCISHALTAELVGQTTLKPRRRAVFKRNVRFRKTDLYSLWQWHNANNIVILRKGTTLSARRAHLLFQTISRAKLSTFDIDIDSQYRTWPSDGTPEHRYNRCSSTSYVWREIWIKRLCRSHYDNYVPLWTRIIVIFKKKTREDKLINVRFQSPLTCTPHDPSLMATFTVFAGFSSFLWRIDGRRLWGQYLLPTLLPFLSSDCSAFFCVHSYTWQSSACFVTYVRQQRRKSQCDLVTEFEERHRWA